MRRSKPQLLDDDYLLKVADILKEMRVPHRIVIHTDLDDGGRIWYAFRLEAKGKGDAWTELKTVPEAVAFMKKLPETSREQEA